MWTIITQSKIFKWFSFAGIFIALLGIFYFKGKSKQRERTNIETAKTIVEVVQKAAKNAKKIRDSEESSIDLLRKNYNRRK